MPDLEPTKSDGKGREVQDQYGDVPRPEQIIAYATLAVLTVVIMVYIAYALTSVLHTNQYLSIIYYMVWALIVIIIVYVATYFALYIKKMIQGQAPP